MEDNVGNIYCVFIWQPWICTSHARIYNIQKRRVHFIWRTTSSLSLYFKGAIQRIFKSFDVILKYKCIMSKTGGVRNRLTPPLDPSIHRLTANTYVSTAWKKLNSTGRRLCHVEKYQENVVLLFCKNWCFSKKYVLRVHCIPIWQWVKTEIEWFHVISSAPAFCIITAISHRIIVVLVFYFIVYVH